MKRKRTTWIVMTGATILVTISAVASADQRVDYSFLESIAGHQLFDGQVAAADASFGPAGLSQNAVNWSDFQDSDNWSDDLVLYQNAGSQGGGGSAPAGELSPECARFAADPDADVGDIMRAGCEPTLAQMSKLMDNPLGNVVMLFNQFDSYRKEEPTTGTEKIYNNWMGIFQFPKKLNDNWNLINRVIYNIPSTPLDQDDIDDFDPDNPGAIPPGNGVIDPPSDGGMPLPVELFPGRTTGFGDMYYNGLFSPSEGTKVGKGSFLWGAGFDLSIPTATEDVLGTGKWSAGPSALAVYMGPKWKVGALVQQYWDFAGDSDRADVNVTNIQYFIYYSLNPTTSIGMSPNIIGNHEQSSGNKWTVPVGLGINKTIQVGKVPVRIGVEAHYSVVTPDDIVGTKWSYRMYVIPAVPSALFKWMQ